jgi:hypothetical protein
MEHDSIASIRQCTLNEHNETEFRTLSGREILEQQGLHLIRVPTVEPILNRQWFVQEICKARARFASKHARN